MDRLARGLAAAALAAAILAWAAPLARADDPPFKPGDKVEYRAGSDKWELVTFLRLLPGGTQALIRQMPSQFFPEGFQRACSLDDLRRPRAQGGPDPAPAPGPGEAGPKPAPAGAAGPPLTEAEIAAYLRAQLGESPFGPNRAAVLQALAALIKQQGLAFRYSSSPEIAKTVEKYSLTSEVTFPLGYNYGPPTVQKWLFGTWRMDKVGSPVDYVKNGDLYRQMEIGARMGMLTIEPGGTYTWMLYANDPPAKHVRGRWRPATAEEMRYQGGEGIVLLKSKDGESWLVRHDRTTPEKDWVCVSHLVYWQQREWGLRMPAARAVPGRKR